MPKKKSLQELERPSVAAFRTSPKIPLSIILEDIRSANNVGSVFRSADGFGIEHVYLCGITAQPPHRDVLKTALGATESVSWSYHPEAIELAQELREEGKKLYALEQAFDAKDLRSFNPTPPLVIAIGNEVKGVSQALIDVCDGVIEIEQFGTKHSLNVAVAAGLALYDLTGKLRGDQPAR